jgi:enoyl-CoA hydratase/carnithine racemase
MNETQAEDEVLFELDARGVVTLTLNRPARRNALSPGLVSALRAALERVRSEPVARVVVLTGAGEQAFCAGGDLGGGMTGGGFLASVEEKGGFVHVVRALHDLGKPVVARLNGDALGGGVGLLLACDLVVAPEDARIGLPEVKVGLWPMMVTALLVRHVGRKQAAELMLLGERIEATEARRLGLVNRVVPRAELDAEVERIVGALLERSAAVLRLGKDAFHQTADLPLEAALWALRDRLVQNTLLDDAAEGVMAFIEKRKPRWSGR